MMSALILVRAVRSIRDRSRQRLRQDLLPLLLAASEESLGPNARAALRRHPAMTVELMAELFELVRGDALERLVSNLREAGLVEALIARTARGKENARIHAAECLRFFPGPDTEQALHRALGDRAMRVRMAAALALAQLGAAPPLRTLVDRVSATGTHSGRLVEIFACLPGESGSELVEIASDDATPILIRAAAVKALGGTGQYALVSELGAIARGSKAPELIAECIRAIGALGHPAGGDTVRWALSYPDWQVRAEGCEAAGRIGLTDTSPLLGKLLDDEVWLVRFHAGRALAAMGGTGRAELTQRANAGQGTAQRTAALVLAEQGLA